MRKKSKNYKKKIEGLQIAQEILARYVADHENRLKELELKADHDRSSPKEECNKK